MATASTVLATARKYLGTVGNGTGNHAHILSVYNSHKPLAQGYRVKASDDWCDTFVSFVGIESGAVDLIGTECGVERHTKIFESKGIWIEDGRITPRAGDIIVYNWDDRTQPNDGFADHIGFVESVSGRTITTIEGNKGNMVARRVISVGAGQIRGYARPKYATATTRPVAKPTALPGRLSNGWHHENGVFTVTTPGGIKLRSGSASVKSPLLAVLPKGSAIKYDAYGYAGGYVWIRQPRGTGYGYLPTGEAIGNKRTSYWGTFK